VATRKKRLDDKTANRIEETWTDLVNAVNPVEKLVERTH
jgi:hypothetical protein